MKKILLILFSFLGAGFLGCLIYDFCHTPDVELLNAAVGNYKFLSGIQAFTKILPGMIFSGFTLAFSIQFGRNSEGSFSRFSQAMFKRFKSIMIISLICTFFLSISSEALTLIVSRKKTALSNQPKLIREYITVGNNLLFQGKPEAAVAYASEALTLDRTNREAASLKNQAELKMNLQETKSVRILHETNIDELFQDSSSNIDTENLSQVYALYLKAKSCWANEEYFSSHYYAECALKISSEKDPNVQELKELSAASWNKLSELHELARSEDQKLFLEKFDGYKALMEEDYLNAYYILKTIQIEHPEMKNDSDLNFYEAIAEQKVNERTFFTDETWNLKSFETANDIYFTLKYDDGWQDIIYFKGMTEVKNTGGMVQYLRDLAIQSIDPDGNVHSSMRTPYAKVLTVSLKNINPLTKENLGIAKDVNYVPYILLKSIDRINHNNIVRPEYIFSDPSDGPGPDYTMLPMEFSDFQMMEVATLNPETIPLGSLFRVINKASDYGYSSEVYAQVLLNRILYPLFILFIFLILAIFAWNNRLDANQYFKATWIAVFPVFAVCCHFFNLIINFLFKLVNFGFLGMGGSPTTTVIIGAAVYLVLIFFASLIFLSRKAD